MNDLLPLASFIGNKWRKEKEEVKIPLQEIIDLLLAVHEISRVLPKSSHRISNKSP